MPGGRVMEMQAGWQSWPASGEVLATGRGGFCLGGSCWGLLCCRGWDQCRSWSSARLQGYVPRHSTGVTAKWQKMPAAMAVVPLQETQFLPCSGHILGCPDHMWYLNLAVWGQGKVSVLVACSSLAHAGDWAAGGCESHLSLVPPVLGGWVGFTCRRAGMTCFNRSEDIGEKYSWAWIFSPSLESCTGKYPPLPDQMGVIDPTREAVQGAETEWQKTTPSTAQIHLSCCLRASKQGVQTARSWPWAFHASSRSLWTHTFLRGEGLKHTSLRI